MLIHAQFTREKKPSLFGRAIVYWTGAPFSHARLVFQDSRGQWKVFHAVERGVICEDFTICPNEIVVASFPCDVSMTLDHLEGIIYGSQGKEYSLYQCVRMAAGIQSKWNGNRKSVCSETQGVILRDYLPGFKMTGDQDCWTPRNNYAALVDYFLEHGLKFHRYPLPHQQPGR